MDASGEYPYGICGEKVMYFEPAVRHLTIRQDLIGDLEGNGVITLKYD